MMLSAHEVARAGISQCTMCCSRTALMLMALLAVAGCTPQQSVEYKQVHAVVGMGEEEVRATIGMPSFLTEGGEIQWWTYDNVTSPDGKGSVTCHVIFKARKVDKVDC